MKTDLLDFSALMDRFDHDRDVIFELLAQYFDTAPAHIASLTAAVQEGRAGEAAQIAHSLKGSSGNMGFDPLYNMFKEMESRSQRGELAGAGAPLAEITLLFDRYTADYRRLIEG